MNTEQSISQYRNLKEIKAVDFHEILFTGNIYLLDKDYTPDKKYGAIETLKLSEGWVSLYDEYFERTDDTRFRKELKNKNETKNLLLDINSIKSILDHLELLNKQKEFLPNELILEVVSSLGKTLQEVNKKIKLEAINPLSKNIQIVKNVLGGLQSRYEILFREDVVVEEQDIQLFYDIKAEIELALDRNIPLVMNMLQWISYQKQYKRRIKKSRLTTPSRN